jgi:hypothetical protein
MELREFTKQDISSIERVAVGISNPVSKTTAGRLEIATQMTQMGLIKKPEHYFTVLNTGKLDTMIEGEQAELLLIKQENEKLAEGEICPTISIDNHVLHISEHKAVLADPELRRNPKLVNSVLSHIQEHITHLRETDPGLLMTLNQQPLPPEQPPIPPPGPEDMNQDQMQAGMNNAEVMQPPLPIGVDAAQGIAQPSIPEVPEFDQNGMPLNPANTGFGQG